MGVAPLSPQENVQAKSLDRLDGIFLEYPC